MPRPLLRIVLAFLVLWVVLPRTAYCGGVEARHVSADAKWFIHLDAEALRKTEVYKQVLDAAKAQFPVEETLAQIKAVAGINPLTDINGVTVYNDSFEKDMAAVLVYASVEPSVLTGLLSQNPEYKELSHNDHKVLSWKDQNDGKTKHGCFYKDGLVIIADAQDRVEMAIDVLDGKTKGGSVLAAEPPKGAFLYGSANLAETKDPNLSAMLSASQAATASVAEAAGMLKFSLNVTAKDADKAAQVKKMADGLQALGLLTLGDSPATAAVLRKIKVVADGAKVSASLEHESKDVIATIQKLDEEKKAKEAKKAAAETKKADPAEKAPAKEKPAQGL